MKEKDYYQILGVAKDASKEQIQRAYRKLARKYHPDVSSDKDADKKFKELGEAMDVLKDPEKRKLYDTYGANWQQAKDHPQSQYSYATGADEGRNDYSRSFRFSGNDFRQADFDDILENLFRQGAGAEDGYTNHGNRPDAREAEAEITVSLDEVFHGASRMVSLSTYELDASGQMQPITRTLQVKIPKGITDGAVIRLAGQGRRENTRGVAGDLLLRIRIAADARFKVDGHDLYTVVAVSPWEALLGAAIPVQTMDGTVTLSVPRGSQNGRKLRLRGKGLPKRDGSVGDVIVELEIQLPDHINEEEERLLMAMAKTSKFNPRSKKTQRAAHQAGC